MSDLFLSKSRCRDRFEEEEEDRILVEDLKRAHPTHCRAMSDLFCVSAAPQAPGTSNPHSSARGRSPRAFPQVGRAVVPGGAGNHGLRPGGCVEGWGDTRTPCARVAAGSLSRPSVCGHEEGHACHNAASRIARAGSWEEGRRKGKFVGKEGSV